MDHAFEIDLHEFRLQRRRCLFGFFTAVGIGIGEGGEARGGDVGAVVGVANGVGAEIDKMYLLADEVSLAGGAQGRIENIHATGVFRAGELDRLRGAIDEGDERYGGGIEEAVGCSEMREECSEFTGLRRRGFDDEGIENPRWVCGGS